MNFDDYEQLPTPSTFTNMIAGGAAGVLEHCVMYPMDSIKTRMQSLLPTTSNQTLVSTLKYMIKSEGISRPFRGVGAVVAGAGPAHAFYFATYEHSKELMSLIFPKYDHLNYVVSGVLATLIHDAISNPTEVIKQRLQMYNSPYRTIWQCMKGIYRTEGLKAFYRSYVTQLCMNLPHQTLHFSIYEIFQNKLNKERKYNPTVHVIAGGAAGAVASAFTTPLDVIKTLINTQETGVGMTRGMKDAIVQIYTVAGPVGFFKGLGARVLYSMPATAICWSTYEFFKFILSNKCERDYRSSVSGTNVSESTRKSSVECSVSRPLQMIEATYVIPKPPALLGAEISENKLNSVEIQSNISGSQFIPVAARELPSMSGVGAVGAVGVYSAINMNSIHADRVYDQGCAR